MEKTESRIIFVRHIEYCGRETYRPECPVSMGFARLLKQKTLTRENIDAIKDMGFEVKEKQTLI